MKILSFGNRTVGMMAYRKKMDGKWKRFREATKHSTIEMQVAQMGFNSYKCYWSP